MVNRTGKISNIIGKNNNKNFNTSFCMINIYNGKLSNILYLASVVVDYGNNILFLSSPIFYERQQIEEQ